MQVELNSLWRSSHSFALLFISLMFFDVFFPSKISLSLATSLTKHNVSSRLKRGLRFGNPSVLTGGGGGGVGGGGGAMVKNGEQFLMVNAVKKGKFTIFHHFLRIFF